VGATALIGPAASETAGATATLTGVAGPLDTATLTGVAGPLDTVTLAGAAGCDAAGAAGPPDPVGFGRGIATTGPGLGTNAAGAGAAAGPFTSAGAGAAIPAARAAVAGDATVLGSGSLAESALGGDDAVGGSADQPASAGSFGTALADIGEDGGTGFTPASGRFGSDKGRR